MKRLPVFLILILVVSQTGCGSQFAPVVVAPTSVPVIYSPNELPVTLLREKILWYGIVGLNAVDKERELPGDSSGYVRISKDGQYIGYKTGDNSINTFNIQTGEKRVLASKEQVFPDAMLFDAPTFSPDGSQLIFVVAWKNTVDLARVDLNTGKTKRLNVDVLITNFGRPDLSVQGKIVVICKGAAQNTVSELCLLDENGKFIRYLTSEGYSWPGYGLFTPDGRFVVYESRYKLYKVNIDGNGREQIAPCGNPLLVTDEHVVAWCHISQLPACYALFVASLDEKDFRRIGYIDAFCEKK